MEEIIIGEENLITVVVGRRKEEKIQMSDAPITMDQTM